jgi:hypothetical protein
MPVAGITMPHLHEPGPDFTRPSSTHLPGVGRAMLERASTMGAFLIDDEISNRNRIFTVTVMG